MTKIVRPHANDRKSLCQVSAHLKCAMILLIGAEVESGFEPFSSFKPCLIPFADTAVRMILRAAFLDLNVFSDQGLVSVERSNHVKQKREPGLAR